MSRNSKTDLDLAALGAMTTTELFAVMQGEDLNVYRAKQAERDEIAEEATAYRLAQPSAWPHLNFNWDFSPTSQHFTLDGSKPDSFAEDYPNGLCLG